MPRPNARLKVWKQSTGNVASNERSFVIGSDQLVSVPGRPSGPSDAHIHGGVELGAITEGPAVLYANGVHYDLQEDDSLVLDSAIPHQVGPVAGGRFRYVYAHLSHAAVLSIHPPESGLALARATRSRTPLILKRQPQIAELLAEAFVLQSQADPFDRAIAWSKTIAALVQVVRNQQLPHAVQTTLATSAGNEAVFSAVEFIHEHFHEPIGVVEIAKHCSLSPSRLSHLFSEVMQYSPIEYRNKIRIDRALDALLATEQRVESIAFAVGFQSPGVFYRAFKKATGGTPAEFRKADGDAES